MVTQAPDRTSTHLTRLGSSSLLVGDVRAALAEVAALELEDRLELVWSSASPQQVLSTSSSGR